MDEIRSQNAVSSRLPSIEPLPGTSKSSTQKDITSTKQNHKIWTSKRPTQEDIEATETFLKLRIKYADKFDDRKTVKTQLWQKIANEMSEMGLFVGEGKDAVEKMRLKFSNLQKQYLLYIKHMKSTGESQKDPPPFFELMHGILGRKDKSNPTNLQDTLKDITNNEEMDCGEEITGASENVQKPKEINRDDIHKRFKQSSYQCETQRPKSSNTKLLELAVSESVDRKKHMLTLENLLEIQNNQRDKLLNKLDRIIDVMSKKRSREESDED